MSTPPSSATAAATIARTDVVVAGVDHDGDDPSTRRRRASSAAVAVERSRSRAAIATSQPSSASARAMALPIPRLPPVTSARLPVSCRSMRPELRRRLHRRRRPGLAVAGPEAMDFSPLAHYVIAGGAEGRARLRILAEATCDGTSSMLRRLGIRRNWRIIDVGCGGGDVVRQLVEFVDAVVVGIDADESVIATATEEARLGGFGPVDYRVGDVIRGPTRTTSSSSTWCTARFLLTHLPDPAPRPRRDAPPRPAGRHARHRGHRPRRLVLLAAIGGLRRLRAVVRRRPSLPRAATRRSDDACRPSSDSGVWPVSTSVSTTRSASEVQLARWPR